MLSLTFHKTQNPLGLSRQPQKQLACACPIKNDQEQTKKNQEEDNSISQHAMFSNVIMVA